MSERLQKVMAASGLGSRRSCEKLIEAGDVVVNGKTATLGMKVGAADKVKVNGRLIQINVQAPLQRILCYNKPEGVVCTRSDPEQRPNVFAHLPKLKTGRWIVIGRLDIATTGLLLFTTDGELAHRLMHPSYEIERTYAVRVLGNVTDDMQRKLKKGVMLDDGMANFNYIKEAGGSGANRWYHVKLSEGRNREVRRLFESQGLQVSRLKRIAFGGIKLPRDLKAGHHFELDEAATQSLYKIVGLLETKAPTKRAKRK